MKIWRATIEVLHETNNLAVMHGDSFLLHQIATRMGWMHECARGCNIMARVLGALDRDPGPLKRVMTKGARGRWVRCFRMPEE